MEQPSRYEVAGLRAQAKKMRHLADRGRPDHPYIVGLREVAAKRDQVADAMERATQEDVMKARVYPAH